MKRLIIFLAIIPAVLLSCSPASKPVKSKAASIDAQLAYSLAQEDDNSQKPVLIDIRSGAEFTAGHIAGALNMHYGTAEFENTVSKLDRTKYYLIYCQNGISSAKAVRLFRKSGIDQVSYLFGGLNEWQLEGLPVVGN